MMRLGSSSRGRCVWAPSSPDGLRRTLLAAEERSQVVDAESAVTEDLRHETRPYRFCRVNRNHRAAAIRMPEKVMTFSNAGYFETGSQ